VLSVKAGTRYGSRETESTTPLRRDETGAVVGQTGQLGEHRRLRRGYFLSPLVLVKSRLSAIEEVDALQQR
jgi:hypothetical protein